MVDDAKSGFLKNEADNDHRLLQQGFEALCPAFVCNEQAAKTVKERV
jgi:hypothetical protein